MSDNNDEIRVNDCLYGFCKKRTAECKRCDGVVEILGRQTRAWLSETLDDVDRASGLSFPS